MSDDDLGSIIGRRTENEEIISKLSTSFEMPVFHFNLYSTVLELSIVSIIFPRPIFLAF